MAKTSKEQAGVKSIFTTQLSDGKLKKTLMSIVAGILTLILTIYTTNEYITVSGLIVEFIISFFVGIFIYNKYGDIVKKYVKEHKSGVWVLFMWSLLAIISRITKYYTTKINIVQYLVGIIATIPYTAIVLIIWNSIKEGLSPVVKGISKRQKKILIAVLCITPIIAGLFYTNFKNFAYAVDDVFSIDTLVSTIDLPRWDYYFLGHPIYGLLMEPFFFPLRIILRKIPLNSMEVGLDALIIPMAIVRMTLDVVFISFSALMFEHLIEKKYSALIFAISYSTLVQLIFPDKYTVVVFLLLLYLVKLKHNKDNKIEVALGTGAMATNCFIVIADWIKNYQELHLKNKDVTKEEKRKEILNTTWINIKDSFIKALYFLGLAAVSGKLIFLVNIKKHTQKTMTMFSGAYLTVFERINATLKTIAASLVGFEGKEAYFKQLKRMAFLWKDLPGFSILATIFIAICIYGFIKNRDKLFAKVSLYWTICAFVLIVLVKWSSYEAILFCYYFGWAGLALFIYGMEAILDKLKVKKKPVMIVMLIIISVYNIWILSKPVKYLYNKDEVVSRLTKQKSKKPNVEEKEEKEEKVEKLEKVEEKE